ncbi:hypothetical protein ACFY7V_34380 [[Kitasatospora] papulosa]|uniref:Allene oxide cyclase barrel-like domain-containing protein n=1 Tax=[Kitasatospora] papulosa TaxID=1464011 RepID=A0ABZ1JWV2_9ACTN
MASVFAFFDSDGEMEFREGTPDRVFGALDPRHADPLAFTVQRCSWGGDGLEGHISNTARFVGTYPPNPVATGVVTALGGPQEYIFGNLVICGSRWSPIEGEPPSIHGLSQAQQDLVGDVHIAVRKEAASTQQ